jgi:hypothetical protein
MPAATVQAWLDLGPTYVAGSMTHNPHNGDVYNAYNKPFAVIEWLEHAPPQEEWLIILDADMLLRLPFLCRGPSSDLFAAVVSPELVIDCARGAPIAAFYGYLKVCSPASCSASVLLAFNAIV